jgi:predicted P-loop ATPase
MKHPISPTTADISTWHSSAQVNDSTDEDDGYFDNVEAVNPFVSVTLASLASIPSWVAWLKQTRTGKDGEVKRTKVPHSPVGPSKAKSNDPSTWGTRAQAERRSNALLSGGGRGGVGIMLGKLPDDSGLVVFGIDLDSCIDSDAAPWAEALTTSIAQWAGDVIERFRTYCEISPSGQGVKLFGLCLEQDMPDLLRALGTNSDGKQRYGFKRALSAGEHGPAIEFYMSHRFFTVTDDWLIEAPRELQLINAKELLDLIREHAPRIGRPAPIPTDAGTNKVRDESRSGNAARLAVQMKRQGASFEEYYEEVTSHHRTADWAAEKGEREIRRAWERLGNLQCSRSGFPLSNLRNTLTMLRGDAQLTDLLAYDEMECAAMLMRPMPRFGIEADASAFTPRRLTDDDVTGIVEYLQAAGLTSLTANVAQAAVDRRARECAFHPVRDYLGPLRWDGVHRLDTWLATYLRADATEYTRRVGRMFFISIVARVGQPGCKADYMLVLEGPQGVGKSAACRVLGGPWYSDALPDLDGDQVRVSQHLRGKLLVEVPELSAMNRAESATLKAFITRPIEKFTPKYGRREVAERRQCVFVGTTNPDGMGYLKDATGGRRFWPVAVGNSVDVDGLSRDRDQLFAEAVMAYESGEQWWPDRAFEAEYAAPEQQARFEGDAWDDSIRRYLAGEDPSAGDFSDVSDAKDAKNAGRKTPEPRVRTTLLKVATDALLMNTGRVNQDVQRRISKCLRRLGWVPRHSGDERWWEPAAQ